MSDALVFRGWMMRGLFLALCSGIIAAKLAPSMSHVQQWPGPDWIVAIVLAWTVRRPEYVPALLIGFVLLITDLLLHRPPGLWAAIIVLACEGLRSRSDDLRDVPFPLEWTTVAGVLFLSALANRVIQSLFLIEQVPLIKVLAEGALTIVIYPVVVALSYLVLGIRKAAPGEVDEMGHRR